MHNAQAISGWRGTEKLDISVVSNVDVWVARSLSHVT